MAPPDSQPENTEAPCDACRIKGVACEYRTLRNGEKSRACNQCKKLKRKCVTSNPMEDNNGGEELAVGGQGSVGEVTAERLGAPEVAPVSQSEGKSSTPSLSRTYKTDLLATDAGPSLSTSQVSSSAPAASGVDPKKLTTASAACDKDAQLIDYLDKALKSQATELKNIEVRLNAYEAKIHQLEKDLRESRAKRAAQAVQDSKDRMDAYRFKRLHDKNLELETEYKIKKMEVDSRDAIIERLTRDLVEARAAAKAAEAAANAV